MKVGHGRDRAADLAVVRASGRTVLTIGRRSSPGSLDPAIVKKIDQPTPVETASTIHRHLCSVSR